MKMVNRRTGIEVMDRDDCLRRLAQDEIGRLALVERGEPVILPVNYVLDGGDIVFRTDPGTKLDAQDRAPVCFEIDQFDRDAHTGWSVVVTGQLEEVTRHDGRRYEQVRALPIEPWAGGEKQHWMRVVPSRITGRHVRG
jgi:nitroimidazol reductase NimA-like FMN-containing flavoprotein (pyridoxamine 5'-phosphate oxidase superfamily)